ncbi:MAG: leucine-rich repeat protein [Clostridia bacterium]|nr:leucine-rich repeat protein [Clostridia bacterium]
MKKILSFLLVFIMIMSIFIPYTSLASYEGEIKEFEAKDADYECELHFNSDEKDEGSFAFYLNDGEWTVGHYEGTAEAAEVPSELNGMPVTRMESELMCECAVNTTLKKIVIPETIEYIDMDVLDFFYALEYIEVAEGNEYYASKDGILFDKKMKRLLYCPKNNNLGEYTVPDTVEEISGGFKYCESLTKVVLPYGLKRIGASAFCCTSIESVDIPPKTESIGASAFAGCKKLKEVTIPDSLETIERWAFQNCPLLEEIIIPDSVETIEEEAFKDCASLKKIVFGDGLKEIRVDSIKGCTALEYIGIGKNVESIHTYSTNPSDGSLRYVESLYTDKPNLKVFEVSKKNKNYASVDGVLFDKKMKTLWFYPPQKTGEEYVIPDGVTEIGVKAFKDCAYLEKVTVPDSVAALPWRIFENATALTTVELGNSITTIEEQTFLNCTSLKSIDISEKIKEIDILAFSGCTALESINVDENNEKYADANGALLEKENSKLIFCPKGVTGKYIVDEKVKQIAEKAFENCDKLTDVVIGDTVTYMGESSFYDCDALESVVFQNTLCAIGDKAFYDCDVLKSIDMTKVSEIGAYAFAYCDGLEDIVVTCSLGEGAFYECDSLKKVEISGLVSNIGAQAFMRCNALETVILNEGIKTIGERAFCGCILLKTVTLEKVSNIEKEAFYGCALENVALVGNAEYIGEKAFAYCDALETVEIGEKVSVIGVSAFGYCPSIEKITVDEKNTRYRVEGGALHSLFNLCVYPAKSEASVCTITGEIERIEPGAFYKCNNLTKISMGSRVKDIYSETFNSCESLERIEITVANPYYVTIDGVLFNKGGNKIIYYPPNHGDTYKIPDNVVSISTKTFQGCKIKNLYIGANVKTIDSTVSRAFPELESIEVAEENPNYCTVDGVLYSKDKKTLHCYPNKKKGIFVIEATVEKLEYDAFYACSELLGVEIEEGNEYFTSVDGVLFNKSKDTLLWFPSSRGGTYTIPDETYLVSSGAISHNNYLETLIIDHDVTVKASAFSHCPALKNIVVLNGAHFEIGGDAVAFYGTDNVTIYLYNGSTVGSFAPESLENVKIVECEGEAVEFLAIEPLWNSGYRVYSEQNLLRFIKAQTSVKEFFENMVNADKLTLKDADGNEASEDALVGTGFTVSITDSQGNVAQSAKTVVDGDTDGDAKVNSRDIASLQKHILGNAVLEDEFFTAGDLKADSKLDSRDVASMQRIVAQ